MNVRIFIVSVMEAMHAESRPWCILSIKSVGYGVRTCANWDGKIPLKHMGLRRVEPIMLHQTEQQAQYTSN